MIKAIFEFINFLKIQGIKNFSFPLQFVFTNQLSFIANFIDNNIKQPSLIFDSLHLIFVDKDFIILSLT